MSDGMAVILIVEDDEPARSAIASNLRARVHEGDEAGDVREALRLWDCRRPDLILLDLNLSKYTGEDILRAIRSAAHLGGVPVCVWSSSRSGRDEAVLRELGVLRFITKPAGLDQFMEIGKTLKDLLAAPKAG